MIVNFKKFFVVVSLFLIPAVITFFYVKQGPAAPLLPVVAIANWGPHSSLFDTIQGVKDGLREQGFVEGKTISFMTSDVNFDATLVSQMLASLRARQPKMMVTLSTPVSQPAKHAIKDIPIVFTAVTDPVAAELIPSRQQAGENITGAAEQQDLGLFLTFAKKLLPHARTVGLLYATGEANDLALVEMMRAAAQQHDMEVVAVPVEHAREIPLRMQSLKDKVDFMYVGSSGPIQPSLPAIISEADRMHIPIFNVDADAVKQHQVLGCFGVSYYRMGVKAARLVAQILRGKKPVELTPCYPTEQDHHAFISKRRADALGILLPAARQSLTIVE